MSLFDSKQKVETSTQTQPYVYTLPGVLEGIGDITSWMNQTRSFYPGQTYAPPPEAEQRGKRTLRSAAEIYPYMVGHHQNVSKQPWINLMNAPQDVFGMNLQDVASNPALAGVADAIQSRVNRNLQENILPAISRRSSAAGGFGGTRQGVAEGIAGRGTSDVLAEQLAGLYGDAWAQGLGAETSRYNQALGIARSALDFTPTSLGMALSQYTVPAQLDLQRGAMIRGEAQRAIDEDMARYQFGQEELLDRATRGLGAIMSPAQAFGETQGESRGTVRPSTFSNIGQGLATIGGLGQLGSDLFGLGGSFSGLFGGAPMAAPQYGAPIGAGTLYNNPWTYGGFRY